MVNQAVQRYAFPGKFNLCLISFLKTSEIIANNYHNNPDKGGKFN
jgi:hypothetical protein